MAERSMPLVLSDPAVFHISAEERLRIACRAAGIGVWQWDVAGGAMQYSQIAKEILGFPADAEVTLDRVRAVTHPEDLPRTSMAARRALDPALKENSTYVYRVTREDSGEERWVQAFGEAQFQVAGGQERAVLYVGTLQDITEQKRAEHRLIENEARLRLAIDAGQMAVWELDLRDNSVVGSPELNLLCGFPADATPTLDEFRARYAPGERERVSAEGAAMVAEGQTRLKTVLKHIWPDGTEKWLLMRAQIAAKPDGSGDRVLGVLIDVTESRRQEERLATLARELRHRLMNAFAVIGVITKRAFANMDDPVAAMRDFQNKLAALGKVTELLFAKEDATTTLVPLIEVILAPYRSATEDRFTLNGPDLPLSHKAAGALSMALHELCTNAIKHGALSNADGSVAITWSVNDRHELALHWAESGGPPVTAPNRKGFGLGLLQGRLVAPPDRIEVSFPPPGVECRIVLNLG